MRARYSGGEDPIFFMSERMAPSTRRRSQITAKFLERSSGDTSPTPLKIIESLLFSLSRTSLICVIISSLVTVIFVGPQLESSFPIDLTSSPTILVNWTTLSPLYGSLDLQIQHWYRRAPLPSSLRALTTSSMTPKHCTAA